MCSMQTSLMAHRSMVHQGKDFQLFAIEMATQCFMLHYLLLLARCYIGTLSHTLGWRPRRVPIIWSSPAFAFDVQFSCLYHWYKLFPFLHKDLYTTTTTNAIAIAGTAKNEFPVHPFSVRYYRNSLVALRRVVEDWAHQKVDFGVHMGDILDGFHPKDKSEEGLTDVLGVFNQLGKPVRHMLGNHCLYNLPRHRLNEQLNIESVDASKSASYYSFSPHPGFRFIVLDSYDVSVLGWPAGHSLHELATKILADNNPNQNKNSPENMRGLQRRFVAFGGGVGKEQLEWLKDELKVRSESQNCAKELPPGRDRTRPACGMFPMLRLAKKQKKSVLQQLVPVKGERAFLLSHLAFERCSCCCRCTEVAMFTPHLDTRYAYHQCDVLPIAGLPRPGPARHNLHAPAATPQKLRARLPAVELRRSAAHPAWRRRHGGVHHGRPHAPELLL